LIKMRDGVILRFLFTTDRQKIDLAKREAI